MSNYRGKVPIAELPDTSQRPVPARYHNNPALSSAQASGTYTADSHASNNDWNMANEIEHHVYPTRPVAPNRRHWQAFHETQQPQPLPQQQPIAAPFHATLSSAARQTQYYYAPAHPLPSAPHRGAEFVPDCDIAAPVAPLVVPEDAVGVVKEVTLEPNQPPPSVASPSRRTLSHQSPRSRRQLDKRQRQLTSRTL